MASQIITLTENIYFYDLLPYKIFGAKWTVPPTTHVRKAAMLVYSWYEMIKITDRDAFSNMMFMDFFMKTRKLAQDVL
jgi:hypothetical protein